MAGYRHFLNEVLRVNFALFAILALTGCSQFESVTKSKSQVSSSTSNEDDRSSTTTTTTSSSSTTTSTTLPPTTTTTTTTTTSTSSTTSTTMPPTTTTTTTTSTTMPSSGSGIAANYPGDVGIESHPDVVWFEDFDGTVSEITSRYESVRRSDLMTVVNDRAPLTSGRAMEFRAVGAGEQATDLYTRLPEDETDLYVRFYVKPVGNSDYHHSGIMAGGYYPSTSYPQGGAGQRPVGNERLTVALEFSSGGPDKHAYPYIYWHEMRGDPGSNPNGGANGTGFWGNHLIADNMYPTTNSNEWTCYEYRIQLNSSANSYDGTITIWRNGVEVFDMRQGERGQWVWDNFWKEGNPSPYSGFPMETFEGFNWRNDTRLNLNFVWIAHYVSTLEFGEDSRIIFDQFVAARSYIGPVSE